MKDDRIQQFMERVKTHGRRRVELPLIWDAYQKVYGREVSGVEARAELKAVLDQLRKTGVCSFPSERGHAWDRTSTVVLPLWVTVAADPNHTGTRQWRTFPWHPALAWVAQLASLPAEHEAFLLQLQKAIVEGRLSQRAPFKYRSLQLTGDEKRLEALIKTQLFGSHRLDLELLNCDGLGLPLTYERVGTGSRMMVFENAGSFLVARRVLAQAHRTPYGLVAYGGGNQIMRSVDYLKEIDGLSAIEYAGDLDAKGIEIGASFAERVHQCTGLPVFPATAVHLAMLHAAEELGHPTGWPTASGHQTSAVHRWLSPECAGKVEHIVSSGNRIPEEVLHDGHYRGLWRSGHVL